LGGQNRKGKSKGKETPLEISSEKKHWEGIELPAHRGKGRKGHGGGCRMGITVERA